MIVDYYFIRKQQLQVNLLYQQTGEYFYRNGINPKAIIALIVAILPNIPGFLVTIKAIDVSVFGEWVSHLYNYAWFVGFIVAGSVYGLLMKGK